MITDKEKTAAILAALYKKHADAVCCEELPCYDGWQGASMARRRIDFWVLTGGMRQSAKAYEIKVSRADFMRDTKEKQVFALQYSDQFYYATPKGLLHKNEIPEWAGLIEYDIEKGRWRTIKQDAGSKKIEPSWAFMIGVLRSSKRVRRDVLALKKSRDYDKAWIKTLEGQLAELRGNAK